MAVVGVVGLVHSIWFFTFVCRLSRSFLALVRSFWFIL